GGADVRGALGAVGVLGDALPGVGLVAALAEHHGAVGVGELDEMVVVVLAVLLARANLAAALALRLGRVGALDPVGDVQVVNVLLGDVVAAEPVEVVPVAHLVLHLGLLGLARADPDAGV